VIGAEGQLDGIHDQMLQASPETLRTVFGPEIDPIWSDDELKAFVYYRRLSDYVARMLYSIKDKTIDIGKPMAGWLRS
jgi:hypothetical protein